jgi:hypothetical protein
MTMALCAWLTTKAAQSRPRARQSHLWQTGSSLHAAQASVLARMLLRVPLLQVRAKEAFTPAMLREVEQYYFGECGCHTITLPVRTVVNWWELPAKSVSGLRHPARSVCECLTAA